MAGAELIELVCGFFSAATATERDRCDSGQIQAPGLVAFDKEIA